MKVEIEVSEENEGTSFPWWFIVRPGQGFNSNPENVAHCITGPFFSRAEAEEQLNRRRYEYGKKAIVWCGSGYHTGRYRRAILDQEQRPGPS